MEFYRPTWAEIDLDKFRSNIRKLQTQIGPDRKILAVVKANAYGHGAIPLSRAAIDSGACYLGVASIDEAIELREGGIDAPILVLGCSSSAYASDIVEYDITQTVFTEELLQALSEAAVSAGKTAKIHVKLDTGMGRLGFCDPGVALDFLLRASSESGIEVEGIFTHLASAEDPDFQYAYEQYGKWMDFRERVKKSGLQIPYQHISNSGAGLQHPQMESTLVRFGLSLYGLYPAAHLRGGAGELSPVMRLVSRIVHLQTHPAGSKISYGSRYITKEGAKIATIPIGYADGFSRSLSGKGHVLVRGRRAPIAGSICMDQLMVDVSDIEGVSLGDEVVLYGNQGTASITVDEVADQLGTISWEVLCALGRRVPRLYLENGQVREIRKW